MPRVLDGKFYEVLSENGNKIEAKCMQCFEIKKGYITSTGNFITHYKNKHPTQYISLNSHVKFRNKYDQQPPIVENLIPLTTKEVTIGPRVHFLTERFAN